MRRSFCTTAGPLMAARGAKAEERIILMRVLVVADLHYSLPQYDWLMAVAPAFDLVVIAGDHLDLSSMVDGAAQIVVIGKYLARLRERTGVIVCSGNHDLDSLNTEGERTARWIREIAGVSSDGQSFDTNDTRFSVCAWWDGPLARAEVAAQLRADAVKRPRRWIWVHHAPPNHSPTSWGGARSYGDAELHALIGELRPDIVLSGHVHQAPFVRDGSWVDRIGTTWVFNAGHQYGAPPAWLILDLDRAAALWASAAAAQWVALDGAPSQSVGTIATAPDWVRALGRLSVPAPG